MMNEVHVKIAEVKTGEEGVLLRSTLGSCVGIVFIWREKKICGMAHCFLPFGLEEGTSISAKYVNQGILSLMKLMRIQKENVSEIEVYLAGGANMMNQLIKNKVTQVGKNNSEAALKHLSEYGFKVRKADLGQDTGIKMYVNCTTFEVDFVRLDPLIMTAWKAS